MIVERGGALERGQCVLMAAGLGECQTQVVLGLEVFRILGGGLFQHLDRLVCFAALEKQPTILVKGLARATVCGAGDFKMPQCLHAVPGACHEEGHQFVGTRVLALLGEQLREGLVR